MLGRVTAKATRGLEGFTYQLNSPVGLDLKLVKWALESTLQY